MADDVEGEGAAPAPAPALDEEEAAGMAGFGVGGLVFNVCLLLLALLGVYRLYWRRRCGGETECKEPALPKMKKRDFSLEQLREYDGLHNPRLLLAVNGKVFDVTKGKKFYGPGQYSSKSHTSETKHDIPPSRNADGYLTPYTLLMLGCVCRVEFPFGLGTLVCKTVYCPPWSNNRPWLISSIVQYHHGAKARGLGIYGMPFVRLLQFLICVSKEAKGL